ncbi:hypothetical protein D4759_12775 [Clostridiales bacterium AHG0011]|nr:hypothetical protein [Clostridiales bacterium AHG0011]
MRPVRIDCLQTDAGSPKDLSCPGRSMGRKLKKAGAPNLCKRNIVFKCLQFPENTKGWNPL